MMEIVRSAFSSGAENVSRPPMDARDAREAKDVNSMEALPTLPSSPLTRNLAALELPLGRTRILIYDGDVSTRALTDESFAGGAFDLNYCRSANEALHLLSRRGLGEPSFQLVLWGMSAPYEAGLETLKNLRQAYPALKIVLMAPQEALSFASLIKSANLDALILKPLNSQDLRSSVDRILRKARQPQAASAERAPTSTSTSASVDSAMKPAAPPVQNLSSSAISSGEIGDGLGLIGASAEMQKIFSLIKKVGPSSVNVMITGESGTGKEMIAQAIHKVSDRAGKPFITVNCAAIPRDMLESELFGHAKGAFPGALAARRGFFEEAHEGTILLDEVGDLPISLQAKILRLIQTRQLKALGQNTSREIDVRILSATQKNLKTLIQKGEFREDLYYRLNVMPIQVPALRERKDDILLLAEFFLRRYAERTGRLVPELTKKALAKLVTLSWKGNVRELENVIERAIVLSTASVITEVEIVAEEAQASSNTAEDLFNAGLSLKDIEREYIKYVLTRTGNRKEAATRILGIDRKTLYRKEKLYGIRQNAEMI